MSQILVFGDSIVYGAWDKDSGWVQRLRKLVDKKNISDPINSDLLIYNLGVSSDTSQSVLERLEFEIKQRSKRNEELVLIFAIGINDSHYIHSKNSFTYAHKEFQSNIQNIISLAKNYSSKIIFLGLTPVDDSKVDPSPWNKDESYKNEYVQKFNDIIKSVCKKNNIYFIEIFNKLIKKDYKNLLIEGLHPNTNGHKKIFQIVKSFLIKNKIVNI